MMDRVSMVCIAFKERNDCLSRDQQIQPASGYWRRNTMSDETTGTLESRSQEALLLPEDDYLLSNR